MWYIHVMYVSGVHVWCAWYVCGVCVMHIVYVCGICVYVYANVLLEAGGC